MELPENIRIHDGSYQLKTKKGWLSKTNFTMVLTGEVQQTQDTLYLADTIRDDGVTGKGYFALGDIYKPKDLATALNKSTRDGGLMCHMLPLELAVLVRHQIKAMRNNFPNYRKELIRVAGLQPDSSIVVINTDEYIDLRDGSVKPLVESPYIWIGRYGLRPDFERQVLRPTSVTPLTTFLDRARDVLGESFGVALLAWAAFYSLSAYKWVLDNLRHFNLPVLFGDPMAGKTLISTCGAWMMGCPKTSIASRCTLSFVTGMVTSSTLPFVWDDPSSPDDVNQLAIDLGNAAVRGKAMEEPRVPQTACLVTANFDMADMLKYFSRMLLMRVEGKAGEKKAGEARELELLAAEASAALPVVLKMLNELNVANVHEETARLRTKLKADIRILEGVSLQIHVVKQLLNLCGRYQYMADVSMYLDTVLIPYYRRIMPAVTNNLAGIEDHLQAGTEIEMVKFEDLNINNSRIVKRGRTLATTLLNVNAQIVRARGGRLNQTTRFAGQTRKMVHIDKELFTQNQWELICTQLGMVLPPAIIPEVEEPAAIIPEVEEPAAIIPEVEEPAAIIPEVEEPAAIIPEVEEPAAIIPEVEEEVEEPAAIIPDVEEPAAIIPEVEEPAAIIPEVEEEVEEPAAIIPEVEEPAAIIPEVEEPAAIIPEVEEPAAIIPEVEEPAAIIPEVEEPAAIIPEVAEQAAVITEPALIPRPRIHPTVVCELCHKKGRSTQYWLECETCLKWTHKSCLKMTTRTYEKISANQIEWKCLNCTT